MVSAPASIAAFIPADAFSGPRHGYVYKQGSQGTGYYKDAGPMAVQGKLSLSMPATYLVPFSWSNSSA